MTVPVPNLTAQSAAKSDSGIYGDSFINQNFGNTNTWLTGAAILIIGGIWYWTRK